VRGQPIRFIAHHWRKPSKALESRFWAKVQVRDFDACWYWTAHLNASGYGVIGNEFGRSELAHRVAWRLQVGPIPAEALVCHHCDVTFCVNPRHLFIGTDALNTLDRVLKGRPAHGPGPLPTAVLVGAVERYQSGGISQQALADELGVSQSFLSEVIRGTAREDVQVALR
jgi:hypothetical protein